MWPQVNTFSTGILAFPAHSGNIDWLRGPEPTGFGYGPSRRGAGWAGSPRQVKGGRWRNGRLTRDAGISTMLEYGLVSLHLGEDMGSRHPSWLLLSVLSCLCMAFGPPVLTDSDLPRRRIARHQVRAMREVPLPNITAESAILVNTTTSQILYARSERERRAPASLVKIVTAMIALQRGRLDQEMRVTGEDLRFRSIGGLRNGEKLTLRDLLFILLIPSDNAASMTIARGIANDAPTFVNWMNEFVSFVGAADTHLANPHGLDHSEAYSTAYDMAIISRYAMTDPTFADIVRRAVAVVGPRRLESTNELLSSYPGMIGVKTGTTDEAGECLIAMADRRSGAVLSVVLGSQDRFADTRWLLDYFYGNYAELRIALPSTPQNRYLDEKGDWREFRLREPVTLLIKPWQVGTVSYYRRIEDIGADPDPDEPIGALEVALSGRHLLEVPIYVR